MALKVLLKKNKLDILKKSRDSLNPKFEDLKEREKKLEAAIREVTEETSEEDRAVVESEVEQLEKEKKELEAQKADIEAKIAELEKEIAELEEDDTSEEVEPEAAPEEGRSQKNKIENRKEVFMNKKEELRQLVERDEVKGFLKGVRDLMQGRGIDGGKLAIPTVLIDVVRAEIETYSKLLSKVDLRKVSGKARELIVGEYPEAVWIETCTKLNELKLTINDVEVDGFTVGGFIPVCRAALQDSDLDLAKEVIAALGQSIGKAVDKAIVYGTGKKMPIGIVTRLAQESQPENWGTTAVAWENLSTSNIKQITGAGAKLYQALIKETKLKKDSKGGDKIWIMSENTKNALIAEGLSFNATGAIVTGINNTMPVIGGEIIELDFIPDGDVIVGYGKQYLLAEREGIVIENSDDVLFYQHKRVYKGLARYDGKPVNGKGFMLFNINNEVPTKTISFATDTANG